MFLSLFLLGLNLIKLLLSPYLPLLGDEAYYNLWSKHLALSYNDHPPMIAYIHYLSNLLLGQNELAVRITAILILLLSSLIFYKIAKELFNQKIAILATVLFNLVPTFIAGGFFLTPEQPLVLFWLICIYFSLKIIKTHQANYWYGLGLFLGLGLLSKYPMLLFIPGLLLFLLLSKENRYWLFKKEFYLSMLLALLVFSPVIIWNFNQHFSSLAYHSRRVGSPDYLINLLYFLVLQIVMYSPMLFLFTFREVLFKAKQCLNQENNQVLFLILLPLPGLLAFALISPFTMVGGHWTSVLYLSPLLLLSHELIRARFRLIFNLIVIIIIDLLFIVYYTFLFPLPPNAYNINKELPQFIKTSKADYIFSNQMGVASLVAFYGRIDVSMPQGMWKQFDIWGQPSIKPGQSLLFFAFADDLAPAKLKANFKSVAPDLNPRVFAKDSDIPNKTKVYLCKGFTGERFNYNHR